MRSRFWNGVILGTLVASALSAFIGPLNQPQKKPLVESGTEAVRLTAQDFAQKARRAKRRIMKRF